MKTVKTLLMTFCLALAGCGMTDPWEDWADEGQMPSDRVLPAEVKETLCAAEGWKLTYQETDFYFQFSEDGTVTCNSGMFQDESSTTYHMDWESAEEAMIVISGGGHLSYLANNEFGETIVVTSVSASEIKCKPQGSETEYTMTAVSAADIQTMNDSKWAVRTLLTSKPWWTFSYEGYDFYYKFSGDGTVECNSSIPQQASASTYGFSGSLNAMVLTINGGGHISYLPEEDRIESFNIVSASETEIQLTAVSSGTSITFVPVTDAEVEEVEVQKGAALVANAFVSNGFTHGVVRNSDGGFLAHYTVDYDADGITSTLNQFKFNVLYNRVLTHKTVAVSSVGADGTITFSEPVSVNGTDINSIVYNTSENTVSAGEMNVTANTGMASWVGSNGDNGFKTYVIIPRDGRGDLPDELMEELNTASNSGWYKWEISDRDRRPWICTPSDGNDNKYYTGFYGSTQSSASDIVTDETDRIKFSNMTGGMPLGGDTKNIAIVQGLFPKFLDAVFHEDGLYVILEGEKNADNSQLYLISPTTDKWIKADRDM